MFGFRTLHDLAGSIVNVWSNDDSLYHDTFISDNNSYNLFWALKITHILRGRHFDRDDRGRGLAVRGRGPSRSKFGPRH